MRFFFKLKFPPDIQLESYGFTWMSYFGCSILKPVYFYPVSLGEMSGTDQTHTALFVRL